MKPKFKIGGKVRPSKRGKYMWNLFFGKNVKNAIILSSIYDRDFKRTVYVAEAKKGHNSKMYGDFFSYELDKAK